MIYQNQNKLNLDHLVNNQSSYSIQVPVGDNLKLECLSTNRLCEGQWMRDDANATEIITGMQVEWSEITEEDEGTYMCHTSQLCTRQKISVAVNVIKSGKLLSLYGARGYICMFHCMFHPFVLIISIHFLVLVQ